METPVETVRSADGTTIAFERFGGGSPVIVVGGATCDRAITRPTAENLAQHFTVINYDRRGRGDSGDTLPYAVEREVKDLGALVTAVGGTASVYGHSSGAGLVLRAAAAGLPLHKIVLHEPPYATTAEEQQLAREFSAELRRLLAEDRRGDAMELFLSGTGMPVDELKQSPAWAGFEAVAPTLAYDSAVMDDAAGGTFPAELAAKVVVPALVLVGGASPDSMIDAGRQVAEALPQGRFRVLEGQEHVVPPEILTPVLAEFLAG